MHLTYTAGAQYILAIITLITTSRNWDCRVQGVKHGEGRAVTTKTKKKQNQKGFLLTQKQEQQSRASRYLAFGCMMSGTWGEILRLAEFSSPATHHGQSCTEAILHPPQEKDAGVERNPSPAPLPTLPSG